MTTAKLALRWGERPREPGFVAADVSPLNFRDEFEPAHTGCYHKSTITTAPSRKTRAHRNVSSVRVSFTRKRLAARARPVTPGGGRASEFGFNRQAGSARPFAPRAKLLTPCSLRPAHCALHSQNMAGDFMVPVGDCLVPVRGLHGPGQGLHGPRRGLPSPRQGLHGPGQGLPSPRDGTSWSPSGTARSPPGTA